MLGHYNMIQAVRRSDVRDRVKALNLHGDKYVESSKLSFLDIEAGYLTQTPWLPSSISNLSVSKFPSYTVSSVALVLLLHLGVVQRGS